MTDLVETARGTVHAWQCDHMGHVNVRAYGEFFEEACWQLYNRLGMSPSRMRAGEFHLAVVQQNTSYLRELLGGDVIAVRTGLLEVRDKVLKFVHELRNEETGVVSALSVMTLVCIDADARKSRPFPDAVLAQARAHVVEYPLPPGR